VPIVFGPPPPFGQNPPIGGENEKTPHKWGKASCKNCAKMMEKILKNFSQFFFLH